MKNYLKPIAYITCTKCTSVFAGIRLAVGKYYCGSCKAYLFEIIDDAVEFECSRVITEDEVRPNLFAWSGTITSPKTFGSNADYNLDADKDITLKTGKFEPKMAMVGWKDLPENVKKAFLAGECLCGGATHLSIGGADRACHDYSENGNLTTNTKEVDCVKCLEALNALKKPITCDKCGKDTKGSFITGTEFGTLCPKCAKGVKFHVTKSMTVTEGTLGPEGCSSGTTPFPPRMPNFLVGQSVLTLHSGIQTIKHIRWEKPGPEGEYQYMYDFSDGFTRFEEDLKELPENYTVDAKKVKVKGKMTMNKTTHHTSTEGDTDRHDMPPSAPDTARFDTKDGPLEIPIPEPAAQLYICEKGCKHCITDTGFNHAAPHVKNASCASCDRCTPYKPTQAKVAEREYRYKIGQKVLFRNDPQFTPYRIKARAHDDTMESGNAYRISEGHGWWDETHFTEAIPNKKRKPKKKVKP